MSLSDRWANHLESLRAQGRYRELRVAQGIDFASNDYLGYGSGARRTFANPSPALPHSGMASRLLRGQHPLWEEVESRLARWHGAEAALIFSSGYLANLGLLGTVIEPGDWVASDELNHASLIDGLRLTKAEKFIYRHRDYMHLEDALLNAQRLRKPGQELFVITESLFGMEGQVASLGTLAELCETFAVNLIVDEAHATGCFGPAGSGLVDEYGLRSSVLASMHTGGKALGTIGAYVCGSTRLKELVVNRCRPFLFTTALPPIAAAWWLETLDLVQRDDEGRRQLHENARIFQAELYLHGLRGLPISYLMPLLLGDDVRAVNAAEKLQARGFDIRAIRPPTVPPATARLRVSIHADHSTATLAAAAAAIAEVLR